MAKNILRKQFGPMYGKNKPYSKPEPLPNQVESLSNLESLPIHQPSVTVTHVILFTIFILFTLMIYLNRTKVYAFFQKIYNDFKPSDQIDQVEKTYHDFCKQDKKVLDEILETDKIILKTLEQKEKVQIQDEKKQQAGGVNQIQEKINRYSNEQQVKGNSFCYIGYDKNQRECTNVYEGDICMSGQIFPTMAVCLDPHLRP